MDAGTAPKHTPSILKLMDIIGRAEAPLTRKALTEIGGYSFPTVLQDVKRLIAAGLIMQSPSPEARKPGPRAAGLRVKRDDKYILGLEVRSNLLVGIVMDFAGRVLTREIEVSRARECEKTVARILALLEALSRKVPHAGRLWSVCVGFPGHIHGGNKIVAMFHGRPGWENFPLADVIERRFKTEAFVLNNGNAYIRAERYFGQHNGARNLLGLYLDNAMSMGIIADGRLYQGETFAAGEIGHLSYGDASEQCHCGRLGCIERSGSEVYLLDKMNARLGTSYPTIKELLAHVERNTEDGRFVEQLIEDGLRILSRGITTIVTLLNPAKVLIHGGIVPLAPGHIERIRAYVAAHAFPASTGVSIELSTLDETACAMGAGAFFIERFYDIRRRYISDVLNSSPATR